MDVKKELHEKETFVPTRRKKKGTHEVCYYGGECEKE